MTRLTHVVAGYVPNLAELLGLDPDAIDWYAHALCAQTDAEIWFPEKGGTTRPAKRICKGCPVKSECLEYALKNDERDGVWGGLSPTERKRIRRSGGTKCTVCGDGPFNDLTKHKRMTHARGAA